GTTPVSGAAVHVSGPTPADGTSDAQGRVHFDELIPGSYTILAQHTGFRNGTGQAQVAPGSGVGTAPPGETIVPLQASTGDLVVSVRDPSGNAISGAQVLVQNSTGASVGNATTSATGDVTFPGLPAGTYSIGASASGFTGNTVNGQVLPNQ